MMRTLAVVGMGSIAKRHLTNLRALHPSAKIYAVSSSGHNTKLPNNTDAVINLDELVACAPDYVVVASPAPYHADVAQKLLASNIAVLIEKPLTDSARTCLSLLDFCNKQSRNRVAVGYCLRFLPSAMVVKNYLDQGSLGAVYSVQAMVGQYLPKWRTDKNYKDSVSANRALGGGALLELSHELDYLSWMLGELSVQHSWLRVTDELGLEVEDVVDMVLLSEKNTHVSVHLDFIQKSTQRNCEFVGQHGRLQWDLLANSVRVYHARGVNTLYAEPDYNKDGMYVAMLTAFERQLQGEESSLATVASATKVVQIIDEAKQLNRWRQQD